MNVRLMFKSASAFSVTLFGLLCQCGNSANGQALQETSSISLHGISSGGVLTLMKAPAWNLPYVMVTNSTGESAASVLSRIALELANCSSCPEYYGRIPIREVTESNLVIFGAPQWIFGGTECGFSIPDPPQAPSISFDTATKKVRFRWANPPGGFDSVAIVHHGITLVVLPGNTTEYVHTWGGVTDAGFPSADFAMSVRGEKDGTPSNAAGVRLRNHTQQESLMNVPFTRGIAPGFELWTYDTPTGNISLDEGRLPGMVPKADVREVQGKGFYQLIHGRGRGHGGVLRRFVGLSPAHTYRVSARLSVSDGARGDWAYSFHAAANPSGGVRPSEAQLAGVAQLGNGMKGPAAAQVARYDSAHYTNGQWATRSSGVPGTDNVVGDITLPPGSDSITVWFRLEGSGAAEATVAFDSLTIEDLGGK